MNAPLFRLLLCGGDGYQKSDLIDTLLRVPGATPLSEAPAWDEARPAGPDAPGAPDAPGTLLTSLSPGASDTALAVHMPGAVLAAGAPAGPSTRARPDFSFCLGDRCYLVAGIKERDDDTKRLARLAPRADAAIVLIDAARTRASLSPQTARQICLLSLFGVRNVIFAVLNLAPNRLAKEAFDRIVHMSEGLLRRLNFEVLSHIPFAAANDGKIGNASGAPAWHKGPTLLEALERLESAPVISSPLEAADSFSTKIVCFSEAALVRGRSYLFRRGDFEATATVTDISARIDLQSMDEQPANLLGKNEAGRVKIAVSRALSFLPFRSNPDLGSFLLFDAVNRTAIGTGMIDFAMRRSHNVVWQNFALNPRAFALQKGQEPYVLWFTGLSASGKSSLSDLVARALYARGRHIFMLDGDNLRQGLNKDLGFNPGDRAENIRRAREVARLLTDAGLIVLCSFITPFEAERIALRASFAEGRFHEIFVNTPLEECLRRDPKGLYKKALAGQIPNFTGISSPFEVPAHPDLVVDGSQPLERSAAQVLSYVDRVCETLGEIQTPAQILEQDPAPDPDQPPATVPDQDPALRR